MRSFPWWAGAIFSAAVLAGCGSSEPVSTAARTGAEDRARAFFTDLVKRDWAAAYQCLDQESKAAHTESQFTQLAEIYSRSLGFEPNEVVIQSCEEHDREALAHVNLKGGSEGSPRVYKDAVGLRRNSSGWGVLLPAKFGKVKPVKR